MEETKLTVRVPRSLLENAKRYAEANDTTLTALIEAYSAPHSSAKTAGKRPARPAIERNLLSQEVSLEDYRKHLEEKICPQSRKS